MLTDCKRRVAVTAIAACALLVGLPPLATAEPPTLLTASVSRGHISATWDLPAGSESDTVEVSTRPDTEGEGEFRYPDDIEVLTGDQTRWTSEMRFGPGTYYVHVSSSNFDCDDCPVFEWSNVKRVTIRGGSVPRTPRTRPIPGLYAGPLGDLGKRIRFRLAGNRRSVRRVRVSFTLNCPRAGLFDQQVRIPRIRVRRGRFSFRERSRRGRNSASISLRGRFVGRRRARGRFNLRIRQQGIRCRVLFGGRRGLRWTATRR
jgi:hypothetical protein